MHGLGEDRRRSWWTESRGEPIAGKNVSHRSWICHSPSRALPLCEAGNPNSPLHWREALPWLYLKGWKDIYDSWGVTGWCRDLRRQKIIEPVRWVPTNRRWILKQIYHKVVLHLGIGFRSKVHTFDVLSFPTWLGFFITDISFLQKN